MDDKRILLIRTGGTIDSVAYDDLFDPPPFVRTLKGDESLIKSTVETLPNHENVDHFTWCKWEEDMFVKDSQKFTTQDILALAQVIKDDTEHKHFVITHGTDAMAENASFLKNALKGTDKVVAFTGAMVPLSMNDKHPSDGIDGLRFTLENITKQEAGVHIVGRDTHSKRLAFFDPKAVEKDREESKVSLQFTLKSR